ncbi:MAG: hypothetical protein DRP66_00180 [Planctomycetota bacterium]|nr:MAG: hypothetical protein DRP66_00180 [Planctomycetota bacterium]
MNKPEISVVVIGKNEIDHIRQCLQSVSEAVADMEAEIVYVDSMSNDGTVEAACEFDISVLQLQPQQPPSPSAGRYIGSLHTQHKFILFMDGDALVSREWLLSAIEYMISNPDVGAVGGVIRRVWESSKGDIIKVEHDNIKQEIAEVNTLSGPICLYRREALEKAGNWNPYLRAQEEWELDERLQATDYKIVQMPMLSGDHFVSEHSLLSEFFRLRKRTFFDSYGQMFWLCNSRQRMWRFFVESLFKTLIFVVFLSAFVATGIVGRFIGGIWWLICPLVLFCFAQIYFTIKTRSLFRLLAFIVVQLYILWRIPIAFFKHKPGKTSEYPIEPKVIQKPKKSKDGAD